MGRIHFVGTEYTSRRDHADRQLPLLHHTRLNRRGLGAQDDLFVDIEGILFILRRMSVRNVKLLEIQVDGLRFESDVDQYEEEMEPFAAEYIIEDDFRELAAGRLRGAGIAVAGQVDQIPTVVDAEMVDKPCFARGSRDLGQPVAACQHVDERRFAHVAAADERNVAQVVFRDLRNAFGAALEFGFGDLHGGVGIGR